MAGVGQSTIVSVEQYNLLDRIEAARKHRPRVEKPVCPRCGAKQVEYKHTLSKGLVSFLWTLYHAKKPTKLVDLPIDHSTFTNAQKTAYWNLAHSVDGSWSLTERGMLFLSNRIEVERFVRTRNGKVVEREGAIKVGDVDAGWWKRIDYAEQARAIS